MPRLFYENNRAKRVGINPAVDPGNPTQQYFEKVAKLVPAEIIAAYIAIIGLIPAIGNGRAQNVTLLVIFILGVVGTPIYLKSQSQEGRPIKMHLILSTLAFIVWAYSISGYLVPSMYNSAIASIILIAFSAISGRIPLNS